MKKKSVASALGIDLSTPTCLMALASNRAILTYLILRCSEGTSNKLYIFVVAKYKRQKILARFWGKFGGPLTGMYEIYDQKEFQEMIDERAEKKYHIVSDAAINMHDVIYGTIAKIIDKYIDNLSKIPMGDKAVLTGLNGLNL